MAKDPDHRYATASDLAKDLGRFLAGQPIVACRPSLVDRCSRWSRRHQRIVLSAAALLALAALALTGGMAMLWNEQKRTQAAFSTAQEARRREREALRFTFTASDQIAARALAMVASNAVPAAQDQEFCRRALDYYLEIADRYRDDPEMGRITAAALHRVGFIRMILHEDGSESNGGSRAPKSLMTNHLPLSLIELLRRCSRWSVLGVEYWSGKKASSA
jgi:hypothetical protein